MTDDRIKPVALSIAGFDPGGGAGILSDVKTFSALGVYPTAVISSLTAQNHSEFLSYKPVDPDILIKQLIAIFSGYKISAVKIGLFGSLENLNIVAEYISKNSNLFVVTDPVFSATSGKNFVTDRIVKEYKNKIFPLSSIITPNSDELSVLTGETIKNTEDLLNAGRMLFEDTGVPILAKGGHLEKKATDVLCLEDGEKRYESEIISGINTHGSGCILSSAICANIAKGLSLEKSVTAAKEFIDGILRRGSLLENSGNILEAKNDCER